MDFPSDETEGRSQGRRTYSRSKDERPFATEETSRASDDQIKGGRRRSVHSHQNSQIVFDDFTSSKSNSVKTSAPRQPPGGVSSIALNGGHDSEEQGAVRGIKTEYTRQGAGTPFATLSDLKAPLEAPPPLPIESKAPPFATLSDLVCDAVVAHRSLRLQKRDEPAPVVEREESTPYALLQDLSSHAPADVSKSSAAPSATPWASGE